MIWIMTLLRQTVFVISSRDNDNEYVYVCRVYVLILRAQLNKRELEGATYSKELLWQTVNDKLNCNACANEWMH